MKILIAFALSAASLMGQTGALSPVPIQQIFDNSGKPLIGGCLYSFATGTTTPLATYSNKTLTSANPNPIVLDASGRAPAIFLSPTSYKFVLGQRFLNACPATPGTVIWSQDPVFDAGQSAMTALTAEIALLASSAGSAQIGFLQAGSGAVSETVQAKLRQTVSIADFGAVGDWTSGTNGTNNCTAITNAVAALTNGGILSIPNGHYRTTCSISSTQTIQYIGGGMGQDCATAPSCLIFAAGVSGITISGRGSTVGEVWIHSLSSTAGADVGITGNESRFVIHHVGIDNFGSHGFSNAGNNVDLAHFSDMQIFSNRGDGFHCIGSDCNILTLTNITSRSNGGWGFNFTGTRSFYLGIDAENNTTGGVQAGGVSHTLWPYCELGALTVSITGNNIFYMGSAGGQCTVTNGGGPSNRIINNSTTGVPTLNSEYIGPRDPSTASPEIYSINSAQNCTKCFTIADETAGAPIAYPFTYDVNRGGTGIPGYVLPAYIAASGDLIPVKLLTPNAGGGITDCMAMFSYNSSNAPAEFGRICSIITNGTAGSQSGSMNLYGVNAGTPTIAVTANPDGTAAIKGGTTTVYRCSVAGAARAGSLTTVSADCGTAVDTGLRVN